MTQREKHEVAETVRIIIGDECDEIRKAYEKKFGSLKGLRKYVRNECVAFWTDCNPYLDKRYLDYSNFVCGNRIINLDDIWCFIRDGLKER